MMALIARLDRPNAVQEASNPSPDRITAGAPQATVSPLFESADGKFLVGSWTCTPGRWRVQYDECEYCLIHSGTGAVIAENGERTTLKAGDEITIASGFIGEWEVLETLTKTYVIALP
jgi:uncharacterized protein